MHGELTELQRWYDAQCNGDWEHTYGVRIETLDNPGSIVDIDLAETELAARPFSAIRRLEPARNWLDCEVVESKFRGRGGPTMLAAILQIFLDWAREPHAHSGAPAV
jgi:hypothetical protein